MHVINGFIETSQKDGFIKLSAITMFWVGEIIADKKWYLFASCDNRNHIISAQDTEEEVKKDLFTLVSGL